MVVLREVVGLYAVVNSLSWIARYGFVEHTVRRPADEALEDGRHSRRRYRPVIRERPGLAPAVLFHLIGHTVLLRLADVAAGLPSYTE